MYGVAARGIPQEGKDGVGPLAADDPKVLPEAAKQDTRWAALDRAAALAANALKHKH